MGCVRDRANILLPAVGLRIVSGIKVLVDLGQGVGFCEPTVGLRIVSGIRVLVDLGRGVGFCGQAKDYCFAMKSLSLGIVRASASSALAYSRLCSDSPTLLRTDGRRA
ncbi:MAG: hypothetical protein LBQ31_04565 [Bacteroidales bacterium]|nr:hypothetical protein [Bacteroidales bacterium]